ncbi:MAG: molybdate ABC transporter substrate-binding protein [Deltaproteobacteria bacterium HGW-Deltaproteobacteria-15]|jgi:molybdate transport system substrate-binding protein|nr:MAG: molybdate ABC transporter substrate-binding protein [Deltaproteobacteria bacterium HGW-Deltaproteobacteria-15]
MKNGLLKRGLVLAVVSLPVFALNSVTDKAACAQQELLVSAAASLTNAFKDVGKQFEAANPGVMVVLNFASSGALMQQIDKGAPVDVFASADQKTMDQAGGKGLLLVETRKDFVSNGLVLVVPKDSKIALTGVKGLSDSRIARISLGNPESVPAGRYAQEVLTKAVLWEALKPKYILAETVRQALDYVARGEVDAGFVFSTDAIVAKERVRVAARAEGHQPIRYPVAAIRGTKKLALSQKFIDYLLGSEGQAILARHGFGKP